MANVISTIDSKGELEKHLTQLRLRKLPFTLEVINELREAITKPQLTEMLNKVIEREFSIQWKEIQKKNHLDELDRYRFGEKLAPVSPVTVPKSKIITDDSEKDAKVWQKKNDKKVEKKQKKLHKPSVLPELQAPHNDLVGEMGIIDTVEKLDKILFALERKPMKITNTFIKFIAMHISKQSLKEYFRNRLVEIKNRIEEEVKNRRSKRAQEENSLLSKARTKTKAGPFISSSVINPAGETNYGSGNSLYEDFEYGLSDWN